MRNIKIINKTKDKFIEEIVKKVLAKTIENIEFSNEVEICGEDEEIGAVYLSSGDNNFTILVKNLEEYEFNKYAVLWSLCRRCIEEEIVELSSGEDIVEYSELRLEEEESKELEVFKSNIDESYIIGNIEVEFDEYIKKHNISDIEFIITPFGETASPDRIQFEVIQNNNIYNGFCHKTIIALRKINEENEEFKFDERYLAYKESDGQYVINLIMDFMNEYYK